MTPDPIHQRQRSRATVLGFCLGGFAVLMYGISIAKMTLGTP